MSEKYDIVENMLKIPPTCRLFIGFRKKGIFKLQWKNKALGSEVDLPARMKSHQDPHAERSRSLNPLPQRVESQLLHWCKFDGQENASIELATCNPSWLQNWLQWIPENYKFNYINHKFPKSITGEFCRVQNRSASLVFGHNACSHDEAGKALPANSWKSTQCLVVI